MPQPFHAAQGARAQRHEVSLPLLYRPAGAGSWTRGETINLSGSGVLFRGRRRVPADAPVELSLELPRALTGEGSVLLFCSARIVRDHRSLFGLGPALIGAAFVSCKVVSAATAGLAAEVTSVPPGFRHQCNNLLSVILGSSEIILARADLDPAVREATVRIRQATEHLAALVAQVTGPPDPPPAQHH
jgi:signal transduction histidine kinase